MINLLMKRPKGRSAPTCPEVVASIAAKPHPAFVQGPEGVWRRASTGRLSFLVVPPPPRAARGHAYSRGEVHLSVRPAILGRPKPTLATCPLESSRGQVHLCATCHICHIGDLSCQGWQRLACVLASPATCPARGGSGLRVSARVSHLPCQGWQRLACVDWRPAVPGVAAARVCPRITGDLPC